MYACMHACMYVCMYVCIHVCMFVRTYVRTYIHTYTHTHNDTSCSCRAERLRESRSQLLYVTQRACTWARFPTGISAQEFSRADLEKRSPNFQSLQNVETHL